MILKINNQTSTHTKRGKIHRYIHTYNYCHSLPVEFVDTTDEARTHLVKTDTVAVNSRYRTSLRIRLQELTNDKLQLMGNQWS